MNAIGVFANAFGMSSDRELILALVEFAGLSASEIARNAGLAVSTLTRPMNHPVKHRLSQPTLAKLQEAYPGFPGWRSAVRSPVMEWRGPEVGDGDPLLEPITQSPDDMQDYVPVPILPTFVGAGGGGTGDGEAKYELMPRSLIEVDLRGAPADFMLVNVRGESMQPDFLHGDQILIDRRDNNPIQPGAFALWDGDAHVIKLVERVSQKRGWYRVFSANQRFSEYEVSEDEIAIIGRPVWFGRRL